MLNQYKLGLMFLLKDTTQWRQWGSNPPPYGLESSTLPLSHCAPEDKKSWAGPQFLQGGPSYDKFHSRFIRHQLILQKEEAFYLLLVGDLFCSTFQRNASEQLKAGHYRSTGKTPPSPHPLPPLSPKFHWWADVGQTLDAGWVFL